MRACGHVVVGEHGVHAGQRQRLRGVDAHDAGVGVRAAQDAAVEHAGPVQVRGVHRGARDLGTEAASRQRDADCIHLLRHFEALTRSAASLAASAMRS